MKENAAICWQPDKPAGFSVKCAAEAFIQKAVTRIENPGGDRAEDLHLVRTTIKRLRALLRMIRPVIGNPSFERENTRLQSAARRLAGARDNIVLRETLEHMAESAPDERDRKAFRIVLHRYCMDHEPPQAAERERRLRAVARALRLARDRFNRMPLDTDEWKIMGPGLEKIYRQARQRMKEARIHGSGVAFHRWRLRAQNLNFLLQWLNPLWPKRLDRVAAQLTKLQRKIGSDHDLTVLTGLMEGSGEKFGDPSSVKRVLACVKKRSRKLRRASERIGGGVFSEKPSHFVRRLHRRWRKLKATD